MKIYKKIGVLLAAAVILIYNVVPTFAAENINPNRSISLTLFYHDGDTSLTGVEFSVYQVATADECGNFTVTKEFSKYNVNIDNSTPEDWKTLASTLEGYVLRDKLVPVDSQKTNEQGLALFPNKATTLTPGLYLVLGTCHTQNETVYETLPFMILMPMQDQDTGGWNYDVTVSPKYASRSQHKDGTITCKVLKVWKDKGNEMNRPEGVVVQLLRDGEIYDTVTLNTENNWRYKWSDLDIAYQWRVVEKELEDYTVEISKEGITFVITNTYMSNSPNVPAEPSTPSENTLPQTGQLWWPVPLLVAAGLIMILIGLLIFRGIKNEEN